MKKLIVLLAVLICLIAVPIQAKDQPGTAAVTQFMLAADHSFWGKKDGHFSGYVYGCGLYNINDDYFGLFGYGGPKITLGKVNIYPMVVLYADAYGWSTGPSLWAEYAAGKNYFFVEGDYYIPWLASSAGQDVVLPPHQYYSTAEYSRTLKDDVGLGFMFEVFGAFNEANPGELAFGPTFVFKKLKFWAFYDTTPLVDGDDIVGLRVKLTL
ncbi:MAG: hypothetical protein A2Y82_03985 [Candidatus Buchananbacteria bacterium RBG_13_36_9]|uniref:Outer membrane protein beta-barrel domain-containing protein n=1 Tax=Candidatus Buchananbacteria bacterium RBG_13_36_9 TaxID=1797530 RepID=A0A1G1XSA2_9BACT|nr:MAG: hypothetical protein A2Y82_03985 [Candidatus Buchananbacteria bacterium RBG_13_36_9]